MPGIIVHSDHTKYLHPAGTTREAQGYWASYNRPSFPEIFALSNQSALVAAYGDHYSWNMTGRAQIFRRNQTTVVDEASYAALLRYNSFQTDPIATQGCTGDTHSASNSISERGDLTPSAANSACIPGIGASSRVIFFCWLLIYSLFFFAAKYTSYRMFQTGKLMSVVQSGPTYETQPPFVWSTSPFASYSHIGLPDKWAFPWVTMQFDVSQQF